MKNNMIAIIFTVLVKIVYAQTPGFSAYDGAIGNDDWSKKWTEYNPNKFNYAPVDSTLSGVINYSITLHKSSTYLLKGIVYIASGTTLTIEPGTVIRGDGSTCGTLVVAKGAKIIANGTITDPVVFTSNVSPGGRYAGDWGGLILFGDAPINKIPGVTVLDWGLETKYAYYGGSNENDNSGSLKFVRIEYSGRKISKNIEINGLTLAGVGRGTQIENVQISYSNDDSFELFGGSVSLRKVISYKCGDDDFDFNYGYVGQINNALAIRHPYVNDFSGSRCIEAESYSGSISSMNEGKRFTRIQVSNLSLVTLETDADSLNYSKEAIFIGENCFITIRNTIISGFESGFVFKDPLIREKIAQKEIKIEETIFNNGKIFISAGTYTDELNIVIADTDLSNKSTAYLNKDLFIEPSNSTQFNFKLKPVFMVSKDNNE